MKKILLWILVVFFLIFILAGILIYANYDNIKPLFTAMQYETKEDIENDIKVTQQKTEQILKDIGKENIKPLDEEEEKKLVSGEMTQEEAINIILGKDKEETPQAPPENNDVPQEKPSENVEETKNDYETKLGELVAEIYVIKGKYMGLIKAEEKATIKDFTSLPKEQQTVANKYKVGGKHLRTVLKLQDQCDEEINALLERLETLLTENNQPLDLIKQIKGAYEQEKELTKAQYINKYVNKEKNKL